MAEAGGWDRAALEPAFAGFQRVHGQDRAF
jgi:hypothetical protein